MEEHKFLKLEEDEAIEAVEGFDQYFVTNTGRIFSYRRYGHGVELKPGIQTSGFKQFSLMNEESKVSKKLGHVLVWMAFGDGTIGPIRHLDGDRANNHIDNLTVGGK